MLFCVRNRQWLQEDEQGNWHLPQWHFAVDSISDLTFKKFTGHYILIVGVLKSLDVFIQLPKNSDKDYIQYEYHALVAIDSNGAFTIAVNVAVYKWCCDEYGALRQTDCWTVHTWWSTRWCDDWGAHLVQRLITFVETHRGHGPIYQGKSCHFWSLFSMQPTRKCVVVDHRMYSINVFVWPLN